MPRAPNTSRCVCRPSHLGPYTGIRRRLTAKRVVTRDLIGRLEIGDLVVHVDHGIARYAGMTQRQYGTDVHEYLQLDFAGDDKDNRDFFDQSVAKLIETARNEAVAR